MGSVKPNLEVELVRHLDRPEMERVSREVGFTVYEIGNEELIYECDVPIMSMLGLRARWRFLLSGLSEETTKVVTSVPFFGFRPIRHRVADLLSKLSHLIIAFKLLRKGFSMCHATAISKGENAYLLFGYSGTGKSMLAYSLLNSGFDYMSEDFTIVDGDGMVYCYPDMPPPRSRQTKIPVLKYLRSKQLNRRISGKIQKQARIGSIFILEKGPDSVVELDRAEMVSQLMLLNMEELSKLWNSPISVILNHYTYFYAGLALERLMKEYRSCITSFVSHADNCFNVRSSSPNFEIVRELLQSVRAA